MPNVYTLSTVLSGIRDSRPYSEVTGETMDFDEYRLRGHAKYAAFVNAVRQVLAAAMKAHEMAPHAITGRAKDPASLEKKLQDRNIDPKSAIDAQLKDLAGARVILLTNGQVQRFIGSGIIHDNFDVISVNVHHAVPGTETETALFSSTNYFVQLKSDRLALPEYAPFAGLKAEIQIQTLLNHAWAEMNHDTFYKAPEFRHVDRAQFDRIKKRMDAVMREHLLPAGHDFDKVAKDFEMLTKAEEVFEPAVATIRTSRSNDEIATAIETLDDVVMHRLAERRERFLELLPDLIDAVNRTRGTPATKIDTVLGPYDGQTGEDVARKFSSLLHHHRYCDPEQTLSVLLEMYASAAEDGERSLWLDQGTRFAEHDLDVWRTHGPANQRIVVNGIAKLGPEARRRAQELILGMLKEVLSSEVSGTSRGEEVNTLQINQGTVAPSDALREVRADAISILERMLGEAADDLERAAILQTMREASRSPIHGGIAALRAIVMDNAAHVASIERRIAPVCGLEVRRQMEVNALHVHYWYGAVPPEMADDETLVTAQQRVVGELLGLRDDLNADEDYVLYKTLIGYDSVRPEAWTEGPFDFEARDVWRKASWPAIVARIDAEGAEAWAARIRRYLSERLEIGGNVPLLGFFEHLALVRPDVSVHLLGKMDDTLSPLLPTLLIGLDKVGRTDDACGFADAWISEGRFLSGLADWLATQNVPDAARLAVVVARARELDDRSALLKALNAAARLWDKAPDRRLIDDAFMPAVVHFTRIGQTSWVRHAFDIRQDGLVTALDEDQVRSLLASIAAAPEIDYDADRILALVADQRPALVLDFFEGRIKRDRDRDGGRFDPIPFRVHELPRTLSRHPALLLAAVQRWYKLDPRLHQFRGGRLVANVYPQLTSEIADLLAAMVAKGERDDLSFVLATLQPYKGIEAIYPICMDVVERLDDGDKLLRRVSDVLAGTSVVYGEFGFVAAERERYERLGLYLEDPRPKVRTFAQEVRRRIQQSMAWEQRRAEQDVEQMRRDWH